MQKSTFKDWIFLTRNAKGTKWNLDTVPFTFWSNSEILNYQLKGKKFSDLKGCDEKIHKELDAKFEYNKTVFAFREYEGKGEVKKIGQDSAIFESIITLIKSQAYELESLPMRRQDRKYYYNLNLLTVADVGKFIELECNNDDFTEKEIERINYVNRFLVNKKEHNSRIVFAKLSALEEVIEDFNNLHKLNIDLVGNGIPRFYEKEIWEDYYAKKIVVNGAEDDLISELKYELQGKFRVQQDDFRWPYFMINEQAVLEVQFNASEELIDYINNDEKSNKITAEWLKDNFRYTGKFIFTLNELPF
ncbi:hypothetical protein GCM10007422_05190 [Pedobacter zeae]|uniref:DUF695 domain-containing protein n=1 Tax=Pedobacter zeae TaxID=1737356 RepID=A0ABQ1XIT6_9SPHI|nr:hypothetical protein GCM10007422_05190 [Pedobacter zeae]